MSHPFSVLRRIMCGLGSWPLQRNAIVPRIRWILTSFIEITVAFPSIIQLFSSKNSDIALENLLFTQYSTLSFMKNVSLRVHLKKIITNVEAANMDWYNMSKSEESMRVLRKYDRLGRNVTLFLVNIGYACIVPYVAWVLLKSQPGSDSPEGLTRNFIIPSESWAYGEMSDTKYGIIILIQVIQCAVFITRQSTADTFFFSTIMHLCGQLDILRKRFHDFGEGKRTKAEDEKILGELVRRHSEIIDFVRNIEDTFHLIILIEVFMSTLLISFLGFRFVLSLRTGDVSLTMKCLIIMMFFVTETLIYAYASDFIETTNEKLFREVFHASWPTLPPKIIKDLIFVTMIANKPLHITGGKFFRLSCKTMMSIISAAFSYVSVLQGVLKE